LAWCGPARWFHQPRPDLEGKRLDAKARCASGRSDPSRFPFNPYLALSPDNAFDLFAPHRVVRTIRLSGAELPTRHPFVFSLLDPHQGFGF
jgi:hypothetical protein